MEYKTAAQNPHGRDEEMQWARILSSGDPARGMVLVLIQKLCTAFHEFEPAWRAGALDSNQLRFFRERLANRFKSVLSAMESNGSGAIAGFAELAELHRATEAAKTMDDLAQLTEQVHAVNHTICNSLEGKNPTAKTQSTPSFQ